MSLTRFACSTLVAAAFGALVGPSPAAESDPRAVAIAAYDAGRYPEAAQAILDIDRAGQADGPLLYRLFYCQRTAGDAAAAATLERARAALEREQAAAPSIETAFYLANAYSNLRRTADAERTAGAAIASVGSGKLAEPTTPFGRFALGKLYADSGRPDDARRWYTAAIEGEGRPPLPDAYVRWASRYLGDRAFDAGDWDPAEQAYARLVAAGESSVALYDRLAVTRARLGLWSEAADAWRKAERLDPANADRARYCTRIVLQADSLGGLSATAPDGRLWAGLSKEELEALLASQVEVVRAARQDCAATPPPDAARREAMQASVNAARAVFVAAALEYALAGNDIRETAFVGGYAPLVFHADEWTLPQPPE